MKIVVCAKQVPDTTEISINPETGTLIREGVPSILNPDDANALEMALSIKDEDPDDVHVTVLSMGPPQAKAMLEECIAMGADEGILISDRAVGGSDTWATSNAVVAGIRKLGDVDLILAGRQAIDGDTAQVGPQIAEKMDLPQITYTRKFAFSEDKKSVTVERALEDGYQVVETDLPCVLTAIKELNKPRYMTVSGIMNACDPAVNIRVWSADDIEVDRTIVGLKASPTNVFRSFTPKPKGAGVSIEGNTPKEKSQNLVAQLKAKHII